LANSGEIIGPIDQQGNQEMAGNDSPLHSGNGYNGSDPLTDMTISSETGNIRVMFTTNYVLISMGFSAQFYS
jgi:hypothetical protein